MKKHLVFLLILSMVLSLSACGSGSSESQSAQIANPWRSYTSLEEAQVAAGLPFPIPETLADSWKADSFRVMSDTLLEVTYHSGEYEVAVRMQAGEGQDLSGVHHEFENTTDFIENGASGVTKWDDTGVLSLINCNGYSYSLYAPKGYPGDAAADFMSYICE